MKYLHITESPLKIYGLEVIDRENRLYHRVSIAEEAKINHIVKTRSKQPTGGRIRFRTDADKINIRMEAYENQIDLYMPLSGSIGCDVYVGSGEGSSFRGTVKPSNYNDLVFEETVNLTFVGEGKQMRQVTINLPRNHAIADMSIGFPDDAEVLEPLPYSRSGRICFYGSSITEGGCASRPGNAYTSAVSRWLDIDYANYGFSGSAWGEPDMADKIADGNFSYLVYDYDYNAPTVEHLANTHEPFFKRIREKCPNLPIVMMSRPNFFLVPEENSRRRDVILTTYLNARAAGDNNVFFIDGESFFNGLEISSATVDNIHPTDIGFHLMATRVYDVLKKIVK